jgi:threonine/homoserine/homoserine lactone efflux protein
MLVLGLAPSINGLVVTASAISEGSMQAAILTLAIITGELIYIAIALFGL